MKIDKNNAQQYVWGNACNAWHLVQTEQLSVILERVPAGKSDVPHFHRHSEQFFFVQEGMATECYAARFNG